MNKKDFWTLVGCNITSFFLLVEHLCGMDIALEAMCVWTIVSMVIHISVLRNYAKVTTVVEEL